VEKALEVGRVKAFCLILRLYSIALIRPCLPSELKPAAFTHLAGLASTDRLFMYQQPFCGDVMEQSIEINGVKYVREDAKSSGNRAVVIVDRGWIFAGDVTRKNGRITLTNAVHVFRWESIGFDGMLANPKSSKVTLKSLANPVEIPEGSEIFSIPVSDDWGTT